MKKLTSLLIGCSLALAGAALAQQPVEQQSPSKGKHAPEKTHATEAKPGANAAKPEAPAAKQRGAMKERGATNEPGAEKRAKTHASEESATAPGTNVSGQPTGGATNEPGAGKGRKARAHEESANPQATGTGVSGQSTGMPPHRGKQQIEERKQGVKQPTGANAVASPGAPAGAGLAGGQQNAQANA